MHLEHIFIFLHAMNLFQLTSLSNKVVTTYNQIGPAIGFNELFIY